MNVVKELALGFLIALTIWIVLDVLSADLFGPLHLGGYADILYFVANFVAFAWLALKRKRVAAGSLAVFAICLTGPVLLFIVSLIGCSTGQCPIF